MRRHSFDDERVETEARRMATLMAESAPMPPDWNDLAAPAVDLERRRGGMRHKTVIIATTAFAVAVIAIALVVTARAGSDGDITTVVDQPPTRADGPADDASGTEAPADEAVTLAPETSAARIPSSPTSVPSTVPEDTFPPFTTRMVLDPSGGLTAVYWDDDQTIKMMRCSDPACASPGDVVTLGPGSTFLVEGEEYGPIVESIAFTSDGTPIVLMREGDGESYTIYACQDPGCDSVSMSTFYEKESTRTWGMMWAPQVAVAADGTLRVAYFDRDAEALMLAVCDDLVCSAGERSEERSIVTLDDDVFIPRQISIEILPDGRTFVGYETGAYNILSANVAVCSNDTCSTGATVHEFDNAVGPRLTFGEDGEFSVWYRSGPLMVAEGDYDPEASLGAWDLMVAECDGSGCQPPRTIEADWKSLFTWGSPDGLLLLQAPDQIFIAYTTWSQQSCEVIFEVAAVDADAGVIGPTPESALEIVFTGSAAEFGPPIAGSVTEDGQAVVVYQSQEGLSSVNLSTDTLDNSMGATASDSECPTP